MGGLKYVSEGLIHELELDFGAGTTPLSQEGVTLLLQVCQELKDLREEVGPKPEPAAGTWPPANLYVEFLSPGEVRKVWNDLCQAPTMPDSDPKTTSGTDLQAEPPAPEIDPLPYGSLRYVDIGGVHSCRIGRLKADFAEDSKHSTYRLQTPLGVLSISAEQCPFLIRALGGELARPVSDLDRKAMALLCRNDLPDPSDMNEREVITEIELRGGLISLDSSTKQLHVHFGEGDKGNWFEQCKREFHEYFYERVLRTVRAWQQ